MFRYFVNLAVNSQLLQRSMRVSGLAYHLEGTKCAVGLIEHDPDSKIFYNNKYHGGLIEEMNTRSSLQWEICR